MDSREDIQRTTLHGEPTGSRTPPAINVTTPRRSTSPDQVPLVIRPIHEILQPNGDSGGNALLRTTTTDEYHMDYDRQGLPSMAEHRGLFTIPPGEHNGVNHECLMAAPHGTTTRVILIESLESMDGKLTS